jgi:digeranylgeranylglycerophospholipid reductase
MKSVPDVVVVGGGPCGSAVAANLARHGAKVTVFEEHAQIGFPSHCPGHMSTEGLKRLGLFPLPARIIENTFCGATFYSPEANAFSVRFSSPVTCTVDRMLFDQHVAELAKASGATYELESRVESLLIKEDFVKGIVVNKRGRREEVSSSIVIDGEGVSSRLLGQLGLQPLDPHNLVKAVHAEVENARNLEPDMVEVFLDRECAPGFYAWVIPKGNENAKIGLAAKTGNPKELLQKFMHEHRVASVKLGKAKVLRMTFHSVSLGGPIPKAYSNGFLAVGDVASQVKPTTGGGVILGITCAEIAAQVSIESLRTHDFSANFLSQYQRLCNQTLGFDMKVMLRIRRMLDSMSDSKFDELIRSCTALRLDKTLMNLKDIDFQGRSLLHILRSPRTLAFLGYLFLLCLTANP